MDFLFSLSVTFVKRKGDFLPEKADFFFFTFHADFGPMVRTTDPDKMKKEVSSLYPFGGGDFPEMCLSGLQVQPTGCLQDRNIVEVSYLNESYNYSSSWHSLEPLPLPTCTFLLMLQPKTSTSRTLLLHSSGPPSLQ